MGLLHEELTYQIRKCIFEVHNTLGAGFDEESYHLALVNRFKRATIPFESKVVCYVKHRGLKVRRFVADIVIDNKVILELKHLQNGFLPINELQLIGYLKCWKIELGLLVNFGQPSIDIRRRIFTEKEIVLIEDYTAIIGKLSIVDKEILRKIRSSILTISEIHKSGYRHTIYKDLLCAELAYQNIDFQDSLLIPIKLDGELIRDFELKYPLVANRIIIAVISLKNDLAIDIRKMKAYLKRSNTPIGIIAHFGKEKLEIIAVCP